MEKYRELQKGDGAQLLEILNQLSAVYSHAYFNEDDLINDESCNCLVVEKDENIIGFGSLITYHIPTKGLIGRIEDIIIDEKHRGAGLGRGLMDELIKLAKEKKINYITLTSNPSRIAARKLYESLGFEACETEVFKLEIKK